MPNAESPRVVPGASKATSVTVRLTGILSIVCSPRTVADSVEVISIGEMACPTTVRLPRSAASSTIRVTDDVVPTETLTLREAFPRDEVTETMYSPMGIDENLKVPSESACNVLENPVASFDAVTLTPGRACPSAFTVPTIVPFTFEAAMTEDCPNMDTATTTANMAIDVPSERSTFLEVFIYEIPLINCSSSPPGEHPLSWRHS